MKIVSCLRFLPFLGLISSAAPSHAGLGDWLYFPMYARDTAHAVHWSALKTREDGLLFSASRYPRHPNEPWTGEESNAGWYNYDQRLIDCETGFAITLNEQLLGQNGETVARREDLQKTLSDWKAELPGRLADHAWPGTSEYFLACASADDRALAVRRKKLALQKPARLSYAPLIQTLKPDTHLIAAKRLLRYDLAAVKKSRPATTKAVFDAMRQQYQAWENGFQPGTANRSAPVASTTSRFEKLNEDLRQWLSTRGARVDGVTSPGDGTVVFKHLDPTTDELQSEIPARPRHAESAEAAHLTLQADCRSGLHIPLQLEWLDGEKTVLAKQALSVAKLLEGLEYRGYFSEPMERNVLSAPEGSAAVRAVCMAAAAQCAGIAPAEAEAETESEAPKAVDLTAIQNATTPADALLALRKIYRSRLDAYVPNCRIGDKR